MFLGDYAEPFTNSEEDIAACERQLEFQFSWYSDVLYFGNWPKSMIERVPSEYLPVISPSEQADFLANKPDFFAHNHYTTHYYRYDNSSTANYQQAIGSDVNPDGVPIGPLSGSSWLRIVVRNLNN